MKHLIDMAELDKSEIIGLMDEADRFREALEGREVKKLPTLRGRTIYTLFMKTPLAPVPPLKRPASGCRRTSSTYPPLPPR